MFDLAFFDATGLYAVRKAGVTSVTIAHPGLAAILFAKATAATIFGLRAAALAVRQRLNVSHASQTGSLRPARRQR
jgi:hypothetical protein